MSFTHVGGRRNDSESGNTWIDCEEMAYPYRSICQSRRRGHVYCPDGKRRIVRLGVADTFFSIPARCDAFGKTISGFVTMNDHLSEKYEDEFVFIPYRNGKNAKVFEGR